MTLMVDERLLTTLPTIISQFPPMVQELVNLEKGQTERRFRLALFDAIRQLTTSELTVDMMMAAQLPELLALTTITNPPSFQPAKISPGDIAQQKASSYIAAYLVGQFSNRLTKVGNPPQMVEELTIDAGDYILAQVQRLQYNFNQHFRIANYLADTKARAGLLAQISAKEAATLAKQGPEVINLSGQIGQSLGVAAHIMTELTVLQANQNEFTVSITAGRYPLPLLFAIEEHTDWFTEFFNQSHRPNPDQFQQAYKFSMAKLPVARQIADELLNQAQLDIKVLPTSNAQDALFKLINDFKTIKD